MTNLEINSNFDEEKFSEWIAEHPDSYILMQSIVEYFPRRLDGVEAIRQMRAEGSTNYAQMEWQGFYSEHWVHMHQPTSSFVNHDFSKKSNNTKFDLSLDSIDGDLKTHTNFSPKKYKNRNILLNDEDAINTSIENNVECFFLIINGNAEYDLDGSGRQKLREAAGRFEESAYSKKIKKEGRKPRARKTSFSPTGITVLILNEENLKTTVSPVKQGRNSNGNPRPRKYRRKIRQDNIYPVFLD